MKGEPVTDDPGVMSTDEMRHWLREFLTKPEYGWLDYGGKSALARLFYGNDKTALASLASKLRNSWIYPGERGRFHRLIMSILDGKVVYLPGERRTEWVLKPVAIKRTSRVVQFKIVRGEVRVQPARSISHYCAPMPKFSEVFADVPCIDKKAPR